MYFARYPPPPFQGPVVLGGVISVTALLCSPSVPECIVPVTLQVASCAWWCDIRDGVTLQAVRRGMYCARYPPSGQLCLVVWYPWRRYFAGSPSRNVLCPLPSKWPVVLGGVISVTALLCRQSVAECIVPVTLQVASCACWCDIRDGVTLQAVRRGMYCARYPPSGQLCLVVWYPWRRYFAGSPSRNVLCPLPSKWPVVLVGVTSVTALLCRQSVAECIVPVTLQVASCTWWCDIRDGVTLQAVRRGMYCARYPPSGQLYLLVWHLWRRYFAGVAAMNILWGWLYLLVWYPWRRYLAGVAARNIWWGRLYLLVWYPWRRYLAGVPSRNVWCPVRVDVGWLVHGTLVDPRSYLELHGRPTVHGRRRLLLRRHTQYYHRQQTLSRRTGRWNYILASKITLNKKRDN